jgi:hypothetical protein
MGTGVGVERIVLKGCDMQSMPLLLAALLLLVPISRADEQPGTEAKAVEDAVAAAAPPEFTPVKSHLAAYAWAVGATVLPMAYYAYAGFNQHYGYKRAIPLTILGTGLVVGPSAGQFYAGSWGKGLVGVGIRVAVVPVGALVGGIMAIAADNEPFNDLAAFGAGMLLVGGAGYIVGTVYSMKDTPRAVERANERARKEFEAKLSLSPMLYPTRDGRFVPGLAFNASF